MHLEAHAGLGWAIGVLAPGSDRRLRSWCLSATVLPDVDALTFLLGDVSYGKWHHTFGHNVFLGGLFALAAVCNHRGRPGRRRLLAGALVALCFGLHLLADARFSAYAEQIFWPLSTRGYEFHPNYGLGAPVNTVAVYASLAAAILLVVLRKITPVDVVSPRLDRILTSPLRPRPLACATCGRPCNHRCDGCGRPTCLADGSLTCRLRISCPACLEAALRPSAAG